MEINKEIERIIEYQNSVQLVKDRKSEAVIKAIIDNVINDYKNNSYDFSRFKEINKKQDGKVRRTKTFEHFSCEEILCIYLKRMLDKKFHVKYPNRNEYMHSLFDMVNALKDMNDFSIVRFDFEDFFNSVSSEYVYKKYISQSSLERYQIELLENFVDKTKYAYAGLNTSNIICEIIAEVFDEKLLLILREYGLIFYRRYIDDGILIFNKNIEKNFCVEIIRKVIEEIFDDKNVSVRKRCKTRLNIAKTEYISARDLSTTKKPINFNFLGYEFVLTSTNKKNGLKTEIQYGITQKKIDKYTKRIDEIIKEFVVDKDIKLLRHKIKAFTSRTVYQIPKYKTWIWKTKGFISNYQELRYRMSLLTKETENFLQDAIKESFANNGIDLPYFLKGKEDESPYSLYNNLKKYKTLLFVESIGINKETLNKMCKELGIFDETKNYDGLVRDYLIRVKVGH